MRRFLLWLLSFFPAQESNYEKHAKIEFKAMGWLDTPVDDMQQLIMTQVLELLNKFSGHGHSGSSASYTIGLFTKLAAFEPLGALTGEDWEWNEVGDQDGTLYQNKRCSHVFKDDNGAYDIDGRIFREPNGCCYTGKDSRVAVTFPYIPGREYVDVEASDGEEEEEKSDE